MTLLSLVSITCDAACILAGDNAYQDALSDLEDDGEHGMLVTMMPTTSGELWTMFRLWASEGHHQIHIDSVVTFSSFLGCMQGWGGVPSLLLVLHQALAAPHWTVRNTAATSTPILSCRLLPSSL